jgi:large subunit ribosomal protein L5e
MVRQDKNKFNNRKYRLIVRYTNTKVMCQLAYATVMGDIIVTQANSLELAKYGIPAGYKNYSAAYATGLLVARRILKKFGLDGTFKGVEKIDGEDYHIEDEENDTRPFKCILDAGRKTTCAGARVWGALKGAVDGGLHIPHSNKNFPGYSPPEEKGAEGQYDAEAHKDKIFGGHVKEYMESMSEEDPTKYEAHFAKYIAADIDADKMEDMYSEAHSKIRANPDHDAKAKKDVTHKRDAENMTGSDGTNHVRFVKLTLQQRRDKVAAKIAKAQEALLASED